LLVSTLKAAMLVTAGQAMTAACTSLNVATLAEGVGKTMLLTKLKLATLWCGIAALGIGTGGFVYQAQAGKGDPADPGQEQGRRKPARDQRPDTELAKAEPNDEPQQAGNDLPSDAAKRMREFEAETEAIQKRADAEIQALRSRLLTALQTLQETYTKEGKLDEAVAIRGRIRQLRVDSEKAQNLLDAAKERANNLLLNGSFEEGPDTPNDGIHNMPELPQGSTAIKGWIVTQPVSLPIDSARWRPAHSKRSLTVNRLGGSISQSFKTRKGQKYRVSFWLAGDPHGGPQERKLQISAAGKSAEFVFDMTGKNKVDMGWVRKSWEFTAKEDQTALAFSCLTDGIFGVAIDDVIVVTVNE
jgi:choice-of-anchor C domain-containing protein